MNLSHKEILRFSTCGSIDDGKSTLIGRLLHDSKNVYEDHLASLQETSRRRNFAEEMDFSLLTDGLKAEREQGITIDVAYRYFSTPRRTFIIADTPGHEQYTRNMATGASTANLAILLIDARNGVTIQTKRHAFIVTLLGVPHIIVAINKMDAVEYREDVFNAIRDEVSNFAQRLAIPDLRFVPISALKGDNVVTRSAAMPWYTGEALLEMLESVYIGSDRNLVDLRMPVQYVVRPHMDFRGYAGTVASGVLRVGDEVLALPSQQVSRVKALVTYDGDAPEAFPPMAVTVVLEDERDISRGDMLVHRHNLPQIERHFEAMVVWMGNTPMDPTKPYWIKHTTQMVRARIDEVRYRTDVNTLQRMPAAPLALNEIGRVVFTAVKPLFFDAYQRNRETGSFILIDTTTNATVAAGMLIAREPASRLPSHTPSSAAVAELHAQHGGVSANERARQLGQQPATVWLTGLVGAGKTALAYALERRLFDLGAACVVLDGENMRLGLNRDLDFSAAGRAEHLRRVAEVAKLLNDHGLIAICAFASPDAAQRAEIAGIVGPARFLEIFVDAPLEWCAQHDTTGLYAKARAGALDNFPGVTAPYDLPAAPALTLPVAEMTRDDAVARLIATLRARNVLSAVAKDTP
jgi:bifunctional enzyme CysN/CysC